MGLNRHHAARIRPFVLLAVLATLLLAGCDALSTQPTAMFRPEGTAAADILNLSLLLLAIAGVVLIGYWLMLLLAIFRFRNRPEEQASRSHGNAKLETGWTVATTVIIFAVLGMTIKTMSDVTGLPSTALPAASAWPGDTVLLRVVGHQWWWTFEYPQMNVVTANEVAVPVDKTVKLQLESADVIHSFWAPKLAGKTDTIPGHINYSSFLVTNPGVYDGLCAEFCGAEHARMGFKIVAMPAADFSNWIKAQQAQGAAPTTDAQRAGQTAFNSSCGGCHTVAGTPAQGKQGPDLTHFGSRLGIAANTMVNTPDNLSNWIKDPQVAKPENLMPTVKLDQPTIDQIVAYLENLK